MRYGYLPAMLIAALPAFGIMAQTTQQPSTFVPNVHHPMKRRMLPWLDRILKR